MRRLPALLPLIIAASWAFIPAGAGAVTSQAAAVSDGSLPGILLSTALANLSIAFVAVLLLVGGLYAYASLARFAPYHSWIYLYLVSLTGIVWSLFLLNTGGPVPDVAFILTTVAGINLIIHILRFDRIQISVPGQANSTGMPPEQRGEATNLLLSRTPPRF
jgi:hypothetical protein